MPRPPLKRRRPNKQKSRSPSRSRRAPPEAGLSSAPRIKLQQQLANKIIGQRPQDSDDSDRLVTRTRHGRSSRKVEQIFASGGVAKGDKPGVFPTKEERRTRLRSDTEEILRRSRSKSTEAARERLSKSRSNSVGGDNGRRQPTSSPALVPNTQSQNHGSVLPQVPPTPGAETSILGTLKPRRRQASILHMVDNNDSSIINPEDEEQFLPDNESTPLNEDRAQGRTSTSKISTATLSSASRKRKYGANEPTRTTNETVLVASTPQLETASIMIRPEDSMSNASKSPKRRPARVYDDDDEVMAPPQSSSPEGSPQKPKPPPPAKSKKAPLIPTTEQLQSMMPSKRRKGTRQRNQNAEFDIPEDSNSDVNNGVEDDSVFLPTKRAAKSRSKKDSSKTTTNGKVAGKASKAKPTIPAGAATPAGKSKHTTKSTSTPLKVTTPRTPLPLTRNPNQENKTLSLARLARTQDSKPNGGANGAAIIPTRKGKAATAKQSGGSLPLKRGTGFGTGAESDKENATAISTRKTRSSARLSEKHTSLPGPETAADLDGMQLDAVQPSIEHAPEDDDMNAEPELVRGDTGESVQVIDETPVDEIERGAASADVKAWKSKWGDIDDWEMEFEEVDVSTGTSSPLRVSVV